MKGDNLDISGTPVVHHHHAKDVFLSLGYGNGLAKLIAWPNEVGLHRERTHFSTTVPPIVSHSNSMVANTTISSSMSKSLHGPNTGGFSGSGRVCPTGLWMGVPDTTTDEALPW